MLFRVQECFMKKQCRIPAGVLVCILQYTYCMYSPTLCSVLRTLLCMLRTDSFISPTELNLDAPPGLYSAAVRWALLCTYICWVDNTARESESRVYPHPSLYSQLRSSISEVVVLYYYCSTRMVDPVGALCGIGNFPSASAN